MLALLLASFFVLPDTTLPASASAATPLAEPSASAPAPVPDLSPEAALLSPEAVIQGTARRPLAAADTVPDPIRVRPRLAPTALYSNSRGFGIAGGVAVENAGWQGSQASLDLRLSERFQGVAFSLYSADPYDSPLYGLVSAEASQTTRRRYYGVGPFTTEDNQLFLDYRSLSADVRVGAYPLGNTGLFLQPGARFLYDNLRDVEESEEGTLDRFAQSDPASLTAVESVTDQTRYGVSLGFQVASDLRDWRSYPRRGTFVSAEGRRFYSMDGSGLRFNRLAVSTLGYLPIRGRTALVGRTNLVLTRGDDGQEVPFFYLPVLDTSLLTAYPPDRFIGRDVLALGGGIRFPIRDFIGVYGVDALIMGYLGNAYDNVFDQVSANVTFDDSPIDRTGAVPFRPSIGFGLGIVNLDKEKVVLGGLVGLSPEGLAIASLRIAYDLRDARPLFR